MSLYDTMYTLLKPKLSTLLMIKYNLDYRGVVFVQKKGFKIIHANDSFLNMIDENFRDAKGQFLFDYIHPDQTLKLKQMIEKHSVKVKHVTRIVDSRKNRIDVTISWLYQDGLYIIEVE